MIISALKSNDSRDSRSPIHIDTISALTDLGAEILFEDNIGSGIYTSDADFINKGITKTSRDECIQKSDLIISLQPLTDIELSSMKNGATLLGLMNPFSNSSMINLCAEKNINLVSMESVSYTHLTLPTKRIV